MNQYELGVIVSTRVDEEGQKAELERVQELVTRFGGKIEKMDEWGRRKLAYPIQKLSEGMYTFITYTSEGETPKEVESRLRLMESVLRFLTIRLGDDVEITAPVKVVEAVAPAPEAPEAEAPAAEAPVAEAVASE